MENNAEIIDEKSDENRRINALITTTRSYPSLTKKQYSTVKFVFPSRHENNLVINSENYKIYILYLKMSLNDIIITDICKFLNCFSGIEFNKTFSFTNI